MKKLLTILFYLFLAQTTLPVNVFANDIYVIFYATVKGKTGHIGIAVENYKIVYKEIEQSGKIVEIEDTISTGELTYYDLWPDDDHFSVKRTGKDIPAVYYKLPVSTTEEITLNSLYDKGIPHKEHYPTDGLLKIQSSWKQNIWLIAFLDSMIGSKRRFNARKFNCADFVRIPLEILLNVKLKCKEFILVGWSSTPNKLYRKLRKLNNVEVIKNADQLAYNSFISQRVLYKIFHRKKIS